MTRTPSLPLYAIDQNPTFTAEKQSNYLESELIRSNRPASGIASNENEASWLLQRQRVVLVLQEDGTSCTYLPDQLVVIVLDINVSVARLVVGKERVKIGRRVGGIVLVEEIPCGDNPGGCK